MKTTAYVAIKVRIRNEGTSILGVSETLEGAQAACQHEEDIYTPPYLQKPLEWSDGKVGWYSGNNEWTAPSQQQSNGISSYQVSQSQMID